MTERSKLIWVYLFSTLFIVFNTYLIVNNYLWGALIPVVLFVILMYFVSLDKIILLITFLTPLAVNFNNLEMGIGISIPTEPLMVGVLIFFFIKILHEGKYDITVLKHPLTIALLFNLTWMFLTSVTSEMPWVSFKYLLSRLMVCHSFLFLRHYLIQKIFEY